MDYSKFDIWEAFLAGLALGLVLGLTIYLASNA